MPLYEYECREHGLFEVLKSIAHYSEPAACPDCSAAGARVLSAPHLSAMPRSQVIARDRNERSRYEPRLAKSPDGAAHAGHGHADARAKPGALRAYHGRRPWVIEHS